ncbi:hypothetical protein CDAR_543671 [Caerostris darwini]|uniref:Ribosomal protein S3 n=1 Tax=Caerostris darwini TaxID=1538125 RepID=A0AAV4PPQ2_9ARAC|nr:hypothetical protein CDAR_543671 [Caerostris darwini]
MNQVRSMVAVYLDTKEGMKDFRDPIFNEISGRSRLSIARSLPLQNKTRSVLKQDCSFSNFSLSKGFKKVVHLSIPIPEKDGNSIRNTRKEHFKAIAPGINLSAAIGNSTLNTIQCVAKQEPTSLGGSASGLIKSDPRWLFIGTPKKGMKDLETRYLIRSRVALGYRSPDRFL